MKGYKIPIYKPRKRKYIVDRLYTMYIIKYKIDKLYQKHLKND